VKSTTKILVIVLILCFTFIFSILIQKIRADRVLWICPINEQIIFIKTADTSSKLFVITQKGDSWILRALHGPDKVETLATGLGMLHEMNTIELIAKLERNEDFRHHPSNIS